MKSVHVLSFFGLYSVQMCENADQKNSKYGHFSRIKDQGGKEIKALEKHGKQLVASSSEKDFLTLLKQKTNSEELVKERMGEIQN